MNKDHIEVLRAAGDWLAFMGGFETTAINPFLYADRVTDWQKIQAVEHLLAIIEASNGTAAATTLRNALHLRYDQFEDGDVYILELDEEDWLLYADLVIIRALEQRYSNPLRELMTTAEVERRYGLAPGTAKKAAQRGTIPAEKRGHDWLILRMDAEQRWG